MKKLILALLLVNAAIWSIPAHALAITLNDDGFTYDVSCATCFTPTMWTGSTTSPLAGVDSNIDNWYDGRTADMDATHIEDIVGYADTLISLYKSDQVDGVADVGSDSFDSGPYAASYDTTYNNTPDDPSGSLTNFLGGNKIACGDCFLYVKDGGNDPYWYVFDISGGDGVDIDLTNFWDGTVENGAISHIEIFADSSRDLEQPVPEPSISALLGIGLLGMIGVSRRRKV